MPRLLLLLLCAALAVACDQRQVSLLDGGDLQRQIVDGRGERDRCERDRADLGSMDLPLLPPGECPPPSPPATVCSAALCGNGTINSCEKCGPGGPPGPPWKDAGVTCTTVSEPCDGSSIGGQSCQALGYVGGTLACGSWCDFDASSCTTCVPSSHVLGCARAKIDAVAPESVAMVASDSEIAVAWIASGKRSSASFARFKPDLGLIAERRCLAVDVHGVALAATPSGYLLAVGQGGASPTIALYQLTASGQAIGAPRVLQGGAPYLVRPARSSSPGAGPTRSRSGCAAATPAASSSRTSLPEQSRSLVKT